jgi:hypothetical protein
MSKLFKVTLEFEDKTQTLEGIEAEKWLKAINDDCIMEAIHGRPFPAFNWKVVKT